jgi:ubiquinone/menaquinone biosynthesis C-methylase UbiE
MDYDATAIPAAYDAGRSYSPDVLEFWLRTISTALGEVQISDILDLGCGTGRYSAALAAHFKAAVVAVDPSEKMLSEARKKKTDGVLFLQGSGEAVPLDDETVDLVFMSMVFHHFNDPMKVTRECRRVLREGGALCLRTATSDRVDFYPYSPFFPEARQFMRQALPSAEFVQRIFENAGFGSARHQVIKGEVARTWSHYAEKIAHRADSTLARLSAESFAEGLEDLRKFARTRAMSERVIEPVDFFVFRFEV